MNEISVQGLLQKLKGKKRERLVNQLKPVDLGYLEALEYSIERDSYTSSKDQDDDLDLDFDE
jgi:hypothetical protein